jgi:hypothetical protein
LKKNGDKKSHDTVPLELILSFSLFINLLHLIWLNFHLKVYGIPYTGTYTEFRGKIDSGVFIDSTMSMTPPSFDSVVTTPLSLI